MANTPSFNWETPDDTDLVKDGALAIRTLGNAIDASMTDLKGGTTGQVLSKTSNTDMDFTWVAQDDSNAIQNAIVDAKGDLITATAADTPSRLAVGTDGQVLTADSTTATGLKWASASGTSFKGCLVYKSTATTLSNTTSAVLTYDSEAFDTDAFHSTASNTDRITIPSGLGGKYLFFAFAGFASNATGYRNLLFIKNADVDYFADNYVTAVNGTRTTVYCSTVINLVAGDYIRVSAYQNSGGNLNVEANQLRNYFGCVYLGA